MVSVAAKNNAVMFLSAKLSGEFSQDIQIRYIMLDKHLSPYVGHRNVNVW